MTREKPSIISLAGQTLADNDANERERRLAGAVLHQVREDQEAEANAPPASEPKPLDELLLRKADLERKLSARNGVKASGGYAQNIRDIEQALEAIDTEIAQQRAESPEGD